MCLNIVLNISIKFLYFILFQAIGEPPLLLSISVIMAIKEAVKAARAEIGQDGYFRLDSPATVERIRLACGDQLANIKQ